MLPPSLLAKLHEQLVLVDVDGRLAPCRRRWSGCRDAGRGQCHVQCRVGVLLLEDPVHGHWLGILLREDPPSTPGTLSVAELGKQLLSRHLLNERRHAKVQRRLGLFLCLCRVRRLIAFLLATFMGPVARFATVCALIAGDLLLLLPVATGGWLGATTIPSALGRAAATAAPLFGRWRPPTSRCALA